MGYPGTAEFIRETLERPESGDEASEYFERMAQEKEARVRAGGA